MCGNLINIEDNLNLKIVKTSIQKEEKYKKGFNMTAQMVDQILREFEVETEDELNNKLNGGDWFLVPCSRCGTTINLLNCSFDKGDPICKGGCTNGANGCM